MTAQFHQFNCRSDNFGVLVHDPATGATATIDAPEEGPIRAALAEMGWKLTHILVTHRHPDHIEAVEDLQQAFGAEVIAPKRAANDVPTADRLVGEGDRVMVGQIPCEVWDVPGHCADHIAYHLPAEQVVFAGDTLFALGCGRVFDSTPALLWTALQRFMALPDATRVYCGHEYTLSNARFAAHVDGTNAVLANRIREIEALRAANKATLPTTIGIEKATNPFLRAAEPALAAAMSLPGASPLAVFTALREAKNNFKG